VQPPTATDSPATQAALLVGCATVTYGWPIVTTGASGLVAALKRQECQCYVMALLRTRCGLSTFFVSRKHQSACLAFGTAVVSPRAHPMQDSLPARSEYFPGKQEVTQMRKQHGLY
jgi:hypothetical protein